MEKMDKFEVMAEQIEILVYNDYVREQELEILTEEVSRLSGLVEALVWGLTEEVEEYE